MMIECSYLCPIKEGIMTSNIKENIQYGTALGMLASGIIMSFLCFFLNHYDIKDSVLWYMGQALVFTGAVFGINLYIKSRVGDMESRIKDFIRNVMDVKNEDKN